MRIKYYPTEKNRHGYIAARVRWMDLLINGKYYMSSFEDREQAEYLFNVEYNVDVFFYTNPDADAAAIRTLKESLLKHQKSGEKLDIVAGSQIMGEAYVTDAESSYPYFPDWLSRKHWGIFDEG
jgi:hypothetical protein